MKAAALDSLNEFDDARALLQAVLAQDPGNRKALAEQRRLEQRQKASMELDRLWR
jgi:hypothetical protein